MSPWRSLYMHRHWPLIKVSATWSFSLSWVSYVLHVVNFHNLHSVAGLDTRLTTAAIYFVCIFYSSLVSSPLKLTFMSIALKCNHLMVFQGRTQSCSMDGCIPSLHNARLPGYNSCQGCGGSWGIWSYLGTGVGCWPDPVFKVQCSCFVIENFYAILCTVWRSFDPDPRTRHTVWTSVFAGYFFWLPTYAATQIQVQRFLSMPDITTARK